MEHNRLQPIHGVVPKYIDLCNANYIKSVGSLFQPLEDVIHQKFIPTLTGHDPCKLERDVLSLPCHLGGLNIPILTQISDHHSSVSKQILVCL